ncbi:class I SAM-dependent methyltransferase [Pseudorhodobacter sp. MZDSW-24AT]|uniref:class I SAM-dependent methyltransferase n=1 Tax=Pseudorhodobacter sp. MZDSW-24AT TaxID=2052957 RepID=UPI000C1E563F|nr:methyltransferase domain-containing protein [Pseudorhodobacter sp. MZDSW-24AT]PJF08326.1 SAM-dependent methyltransferase [Pseudorhodobacter sp. MZDSW-24AT]
MDIQAVRKSYARWAPIYDATFGVITRVGRRRAVSVLNGLGGRVLEVGVGTGLSLPAYRPDVSVTGIDASEAMLEKARDKVKEQGLAHVEALRLMDARALEFADNSFDHISALHIMSVVPEPERVMAEMTRVLRPGGTIVMVNHFARDPADKGALPWLERVFAPFADRLGWHSDFQRSTVTGTRGLTLIEETALPPFGMMTLMRFRKA